MLSAFSCIEFDADFDNHLKSPIISYLLLGLCVMEALTFVYTYDILTQLGAQHDESIIHNTIRDCIHSLAMMYIRHPFHAAKACLPGIVFDDNVDDRE